MKKTFKKLMAITLTLLMLLPFMSMYSFAAAAPEIVSVEVELDEELSLQEIGNGIEYAKGLLSTLAEKYGVDIYDEEFQIILKRFGITIEDILSYYLEDCTYKVTLSNGEVLQDDEGYFEYGRYDINCDAFITEAAYIEAVEKAANTVEVAVEATVERYILLTDEVKTYSEYKNTFNAPCVECYIKDLQIISGVPDVVNVRADYVPLDGAQFKVTYPDGTSETGTVKEIIVNEGKASTQYKHIEYELLGQELWIDTYGVLVEENDYIEFYYGDFILKKEVNTVSMMNFKGIEITDYNLDDDGELIDVTYEIAFADNTTRTYTDNVEENGIIKNNGYVYGTRFIDGYEVGIEYIEYYPEDASNKYEYGFALSIGDCYDEVILGEAESNGAAGTIIARLLAAFKALLARFVEIISNILGK
ncbi:MAG: hypothetical protein ACI4GC_07925 [Acutalibacteraceae bacterium]